MQEIYHGCIFIINGSGNTLTYYICDYADITNIVSELNNFKNNRSFPLYKDQLISLLKEVIFTDIYIVLPFELVSFITNFPSYHVMKETVCINGLTTSELKQKFKNYSLKVYKNEFEPF